MLSVLEAIAQKRNIKASSLNIYKANLGKAHRVMSGGEFNTKFLEDKVKVEEFLEPLKNPTKRTYLASFIVALEATDGEKELVDYYKKRMKETQDKVDKTYEDGNMSDKQKNNWVSFSALRAVTKSLYKELKDDKAFDRTELSDKQRSDMQNWVIASLYTLGGDENPPVRLDYATMKAVRRDKFDTIPDEEKKENNYLIIGKRDMVFNFNNFKTESAYGSTTIKVGKAIKAVLAKWLKYIPEDGHLFTNKGSPMNNHSFGMLLTKIFSRTGKTITSSLIRTIYLTEKFPRQEIKDKQDTANKMMNSVQVQQDVYRKQLLTD